MAPTHCTMEGSGPARNGVHHDGAEESSGSGSDSEGPTDSGHMAPDGTAGYTLLLHESSSEEEEEAAADGYYPGGEGEVGARVRLRAVISVPGMTCLREAVRLRANRSRARQERWRAGQTRRAHLASERRNNAVIFQAAAMLHASPRLPASIPVSLDPALYHLHALLFTCHFLFVHLHASACKFIPLPPSRDLLQSKTWWGTWTCLPSLLPPASGRWALRLHRCPNGRWLRRIYH